MKAYGVKKADSPFDCTDRGKYNATELKRRCSCGRKHGKKSKDHKSRKAKMRRIDARTT